MTLRGTDAIDPTLSQLSFVGHVEQVIEVHLDRIPVAEPGVALPGIEEVSDEDESLSPLPTLERPFLLLLRLIRVRVPFLSRDDDRFGVLGNCCDLDLTILLLALVGRFGLSC